MQVRRNSESACLGAAEGDKKNSAAPVRSIHNEQEERGYSSTSGACI